MHPSSRSYYLPALSSFRDPTRHLRKRALIYGNSLIPPLGREISPFRSLFLSLRYHCRCHCPCPVLRRGEPRSAIITLSRSLSAAQPRAIRPPEDIIGKRVLPLVVAYFLSFFSISLPRSFQPRVRSGFTISSSRQVIHDPAPLSPRRVIRKWNNVPSRNKGRPDRRAPCRIV